MAGELRGPSALTRRVTMFVTMSLLAGVLAYADSARPSSAAVENFPDGTEVEVTIDSPADGSPIADGSATLEGTARVGAGEAPPDTSLVVVYDLSGSTLDPAGGDCGGDVNGDGRSNTILDCEIAAMEALEQTAAGLGSVAEMGVVLFELGSAAADVQPASGAQRLTEPGADLNGNGTTDIAEVVRSSRWSSGFFSADATVSLFTRYDAGTGNGGTNYSAGLSRACETLAATSQPNRTIVFLSDGAANRGTNVANVLPCGQAATVHSVAVGANSTCASNPSGLGSLQDVADLTDGTCTEVVSPEELPDILSGIISPEITGLTLSVNGGPAVDISSETSVPLPAKGPDPIDWSSTLEGLTGPVDEVCVTVTAGRGDEVVTATECIELISDRPPVADAGPDRTVDEGSLVELDGTGSFDPDGDPLSYQWEIVAQDGAPIVLTSTTEPIASFIAFDDGTYDFRLTVSDGRTAVSDDVTITVGNVAPIAEALAEPASEGGMALVTASFTDAGILDTHTATIDWGDGSPTEDVTISAQGNGWGSLYATHVYGDAGSFTATITVVDDDGGVDAVTSVAVEVADSLALWANSETSKLSFDATGGGGLVEGLTHSNGDLRVRGADKTFDGRVEYVGELDTQNTTFTEPPVQVDPAPYPITFDVADYAPGGRGAIDAGTSYFDMSAACGNGTWDPTGPLASGLYYAPCAVKLNADALAGTVTVAATGNIQVSGSSADFEPFIDGLLFLSGSADNRAIQVSSSNSTYLGYLFAGTGSVDLAGSGNTYLCGILADRIDLADSGLTIRASDCIRPERTVAPPVLVPELDLGVDVMPADAIPGDAVSTETTLTNTGSLLLVPGIVGLENLGDAPVTVSSIGLGIEYLPVGGTWTPLSEPITVASTPNPAPGVTYGPDFAGTVIDPDGLATWGAEMQVFLPPATVDFLLDESQVAAVRNTFTYALDNPSSEPVRGLFRFGNDFSEDLRALSGDLTDLRVVQTSTDGTADLVDAADEPALASLAPGQSVSVSSDAVVPVPDPRGVLEPVDAYLARLAALDGTELAGSAFALASGGVGTVLGPFDFDTVTRHLPVVGLDLTGPELLVAGDTATYGIGLRNTGSADAPLVDTELVVDGDPIATSAATSLPAGGIDDSTASVVVPPDRPVGFIEALATTSWTDANGNDYGDVDDEVTTEIGSPPDLSALLADTVEIDADNSGLPSAGDTVRYTATVTNRGTTPATGVVFQAPIDPQSDLVDGSVTTSLGSVASGNAPGDTTVTVDAGTVPAMSSLEISFDVVILPGTTTLSVQGSVASDDAPSFVTDDPGAPGLEDPTVTTVVETPPSLQAILVGRLAVDADGDGLIGPGDTVEYSLQVSNSGLTSATGVTATLAPDANTALVPGSVDTDATVVDGNDAGDSTLVVSFGEVPGLNQWMVDFEVTVDDLLPAGTSEIATQATITSNELADVVSDDPSVGGTADPTALSVVTTTGGAGGGGGGTTGPAPTFEDDAVGPPDGTTVTTPIDITLSGVTPPADTTIASWEVIAYPANGAAAEGIVLASGTGDPPTGPIATFDPTVVSNGTWLIQVAATDSDGGVGTAQTSVIVEGALKLGRYAVTYADSQVSVAGIPLTVERTYDTVARTESGDFGYGWSLDVANFEVSTNRVLGEGPWSAESCGAGLIFVPLCFSADGPRLVNVTWPTGRVETFELAPTGNTFFPIFMTAEYEPRPGVTSTLRPAPGDELGGLGGDGHMHSEGFGYGPIYDPQQFILESSDGTEYLLDKEQGLLRATDRYGNTVTYTETGIVSSLGPALTFARDAEGRITSLTEPGGDTVTYGYDAAGDLVSVVDQAGDETTFTYDAGHYLTVIDDEGPGPYRTLNYGPDGRVESITDAEGNTTAIDVDVDARTQVVTAPDGRSTRLTTFDDRGNALQVDHVYDGESHISTLTYDSEDRVTSRTDPLGNTWRAAYDANGNLTSYEDPTGAVTTYEYGAFDLPVSITDATGAARSFEYDAVGNLVAVDHPAGATSGTDLDSTPFSAQLTGAGGRETFTYDSAGNLLTRTDALGNSWQWSYDGQGNIVDVTDPLGQVTSYTYDGEGRLLSETDGEAATTTYTYDSVGNLTSMTDPLGRTRTFEYDGRDNVVATEDPGGNRTIYGYDDTNNIVSETDPTGRTWQYDYAFGRLVSTTAPDGGITTHGYDASGRTARVTDPLGRTTSYGYDEAGRWTTTTYPYGDGQTATATNELDAAGLPIAYVDGLGHRWTFSRDEMGRVIQSTDPLGATHTTTFDALGRVLDVQDPLGNATSYAYDSAGRLTGITTADGERTSYEYDEVGNQTAVVDPLSRRTTFGYDAAYRHVSTTDPDGNTATTVYDAAGQVIESTTFAGVTTTLSYDDRGLLTSLSDELGNSVTIDHDGAGRQVTRTDARGNATTYGYDAVGRPTTTTDAIGGVAMVEYDLAGQRTGVVDPMGSRRVIGYDDAGLVSSQTDALGRTWQASYDAAGRQVEVIDPRGTMIEFDYDAAGRLVQRQSSSEVATYAYDALGRRTTLDDPSGTSTWRYDEAGRVTAVETAAGDVTYTYDAAGQLVGMAQPEGSVSYDYSANGFVEQITDWNGAVVAVDSDADGRIVGIDRPNGIQTVFDHDAAGRVVGVAHDDGSGEVAGYDYVLDPNGNRVRVDIVDGTGTRSELYGYDALDRLTSVDYGDGVSESFEYDANGNRTQRTVVGGAAAGLTDYVYDSAQQLRAVSNVTGTSTLSYDSAGNLVDDGDGNTFVWDDFGRMSSATVEGVTETYAYDADGVRVGVDGQGQVWDRGAAVPRLLSDGDSGYVHLGGQVLSEHGTTTGTSWPLSDALGSVRTITDGSGTTTSSYAYDVFGELRSATGPAPTFGFTSEQLDASGLYHLRARQYDPEVGRFLSADSVQPNAPGTQGWNLYGYANANPTTFMDPTGHLAAVEYASLVRNSVITQTALRLLGLCVKGILEGIAFGLVFADVFGYDYEFEWEWALVDCAIEIIFAGFGPSGPRSPKPPDGAPPRPRPENPRPHGPDNPPGPRPHGPDGPPRPRDPDAPPRPRDPDAPPRPRDPEAPTPRDAEAPPCSFAADTGVVTINGTVPIAELEAGDLVLAMDPESGETTYRTVRAVLEHGDRLVELRVGDGSLTTTEDHPFWNVTDAEWQAADDLDRGDLVRTRDGVAEVHGIVAGPAMWGQAFNINVDGLHTYFVDAGAEEVLVHNSHTCRWQLRNSDGTIRDSGFIESGTRTPPGRRLTWTEQLTTHTEYKLMEDLQGVTRPGDIVSIQGTKPPCNPGGRGCQNVMAEFAEQNGVTIIYTQVGDGTWRWP